MHRVTVQAGSHITPFVLGTPDRRRVSRAGPATGTGEQRAQSVDLDASFPASRSDESGLRLLSCVATRTYALGVRTALGRPAVQWGVRVFAFMVLIVDGRVAGWSWLVSAISALVVVYVSVLVGVRICLHRDVRRGLARREWRALGGMAFDARRRAKGEFDWTALRWTKGTDESTLVAYATILLNLLIARELGPRPTSEQIDQLVARHGPAWAHLMGRDQSELDPIVRAACRYQAEGFPAPSWDNCRGLAAAVGILGSAPVRRSLRRAVMTQYSRARAVPAA